MGQVKQGPASYATWSPEKDRELTELREAGLTYEDLAVKFGRTVGAVKSRLRHLGMLDARGKPE